MASAEWRGVPPNRSHSRRPDRRSWKRAQFDEIVILQIRDGKVLRQRGIVDNLSALRQLGVVPTPRA